MKNKLWILMLCFSCLFLFGCEEQGEDVILKKLVNEVEKSKGYHLVGEMKIQNQEDSYLYDVDVAYQNPNYFRVGLKNQMNNHEQIILKNEEGVYVLTPSLNKSFKFQSEWPYNNSQIYLLQTIVKDIKNDKNKTFKETKDGYQFTSNVNFSNNPDLEKQVVLFDKDLNLKEIEIKNANDQTEMKLTVKKLDKKATFQNSYFSLKENMTVANEEETTESVSTIEDIIYPMYIPANTHLENQEKVSTSFGERIIETFGGERPFTFVQETAVVEKEHLTIPVYGEPSLISGTIGAVSDTSVSWMSDGMEYYVVSDVLSEEELLEVANSISVMPVGK